jgi:hypothetical protein
MRTRTLAALAAVTALTAASCGGGDSGMSTGDFREALAEICSDTTDDVERLDQPDLEDPSTIEEFAVELREIVERTKGELDELEAPDNLSDDYDRFKGLVDDRLQAVEDLEQAAQDEDGAEIEEIGGRIVEITEESREVADDLGVEECGEQGGDPEPDDTATGETSEAAATTAVVTVATTVAPTTAAPSTLPPVTLPPATAPPRTTTPATTVPVTTVAATTPPATAPADTTVEVLFDIMDLPARFNSFPPYTLGPPTAQGESEFIQIVADDILLNIAIDEMGVGVIRDETGEAVASIVVGFAIDETIGMPNEWKNMICDPAVATLYTTEGGALGVYCEFFDDETNPIFEVFSATTTEVGLTIATLTPFVTLDELVDGFLGANT